MTTLPNKMNAVLLLGHGDTDQLQFRTDVPVPTPADNEVLIKVGAAGVNNTDINTRLAWYSKSDSSSEDASWAGEPIHFPRIQGADVCGVIVQVGKNVDDNRIGERVLVEPCITEFKGKTLDPAWYFGSECDGGFAQYATVASKHAYKVDSDLLDVELASFPCSYSTAENLLTRAGVKQGETVLVTGASGGVGSAAVQLAHARGAKIIGITSAKKSQNVLSLGASATIDRHASFVETLGKNSVDVVIDLVAGNKWGELLEVLKSKGRYAVSGAIAGPIVELDVRTLYLKDLSFYGCTILEPEVFANLIKHIENRSIKPVVAHSFPLAQIVEAQEMFLSKSHTGKIVLSVD